MNDTVNKAKVLDRVRKLLGLATSANENEATAAAEKAQAILAEYNLSMDEVTQTDSKAVEFEVASTDLTDSKPWRRPLATWCAKLYFCTYFFTFIKKPTARRKNGYIRYDIHNFVGEEHNAIVARMMFLYLSATVENLANDAASKQYSNRSSYRTSFMNACGDRVARRLYERYVASKQGGVSGSTGNTLPALLDLYKTTEELLAEFMKKREGMKTHKRKKKMTNVLGVLHGREAGDKVGLDTQLSPTAKNKSLPAR